ncbi:hypothetical protein J2751_002727 [Halorubrum alkaliphilum]|uniref:Uncharacterized protein n=1 Tax=Halorubrum alkaliphilum TaxID=261290 RepID=A0A8T4GL03_9EURY|nr:hypothetical protein [Halorubrum alkaliphilum]
MADASADARSSPIVAAGAAFRHHNPHTSVVQ